MAALALIAVSCTSDSDDAVATDESIETASSSTAGAPDASTGAPDSTAPPSSTVAPLTAPLRGVSADTITVGVLTADLAAISDVVDINNGDVGLVYQTLIDDLNERGGILGRSVEMKLVKYSPLETVDAERACLTLTEDFEIFAVLGAFFGPVRGTNTCVNGVNETILLGGTHTPELLAQSAAPWITDGMSAERLFNATVDLYAAEGLLDGRTIAVFDVSSEHDITRDVLLPALERVGVTDPLVLTSDVPPADVAALTVEVEVFAERLAVDGIDLVLLVNSQVPLGFGLLRDFGYIGDIYTIEEGPQLGEIGGYDNSRDPAIYDGAIGAMGLSEEEAFAMDRTQQCVETFESANPEIDVMRSDLVADGDADWMFTLYGACRVVRVLELIGNEAGVDLTNETFAAGAARLATFETAGRPFNSLADGKFDANDGLRLGVFDSGIPPAGGLAPITEYTNIG